ncbi:MAG: amidohydrolase [Proteobacteria bacterium]|nr:amidohydrolase [Pseudomonadota bacterium]
MMHSPSASRLALAIGALLIGCGAERTVYRGGPILTMDPENRVAEALGVAGERIAQVGDEAAVLAWAGPNARIVELQGRVLLPGFVDAHGHFPGEGIYGFVADLQSPPVGSVVGVEDLLARLSEQAARTSADDWILGLGYDDSLLREGRHPTREELDRVAPERPVAAIHVSGHLGVVNSAALAVLGIGPETPDPPGGHIARDASGKANGLLEESALDPVVGRLMTPSLLDALRIAREASRRAVAQGVTTVQNGLTPAAQIGPLLWLGRLGLLPHRLVLWPSMEALDQALAAGKPLPTRTGPRVWVGAVKLVADGSIQGYTGYLSAPYHVPPGDDPSFRGYPRIPADELAERVLRYHRAGFQLAVHGNGDASIDDILDALERALVAHPRPDARPIVIHAQMARPDQLDRMRALGASPSFFSLHTFYWGDRHRTRFMGPERAARMSPAATALAKGVRFSIHCDAPVVPMEPLRLVWSAVARRTRSGFVIGEAERLTPMQALRAVTIDAAWQQFLDAELGSLEPGKRAALVVLSGDPRNGPGRIHELRVLETIVGGETVFRAPTP